MNLRHKRACEKTKVFSNVLFISIDGEQQNHINGGIQSILDIVSSRITEMRRRICYTLHDVYFLNPFVIIVLNILYSSTITVNFHYI